MDKRTYLESTPGKLGDVAPLILEVMGVRIAEIMTGKCIGQS